MRAVLPFLLLLAVLGTWTAPGLFADGGAVVLHRDAGPFVITVFASPAPLRAGPADLSVMIQRRDSLDPVLDAAVSLTVERNGAGLTLAATRDQAQNKLLYAATVNLTEPGLRKYSVNVHHGAEDSELSGTLSVEPPQPKIDAYWGYFALPPLCIAIFVIHQLLARRQRLTSGV